MANGTDTIDLSAGFVNPPPQKKDSGIDLSAGFVKTPAGGSPPSAGVFASGHDQIKRKYGLPPSADLTKGFFDPANKDVQDAELFSRAYQEANPPKPEEPGVLRNLWSEAKQKVAGFFQQPEDPFGGTEVPMMGPATELFRPVGEAVEQARAGEYGEAAKSAVRAVPFVGPDIVARGEDIAAGQYRRALGKGLVDLATLEFMRRGAAHGLREKLPPQQQGLEVVPRETTPFAPPEPVGQEEFLRGGPAEPIPTLPPEFQPPEPAGQEAFLRRGRQSPLQRASRTQETTLPAEEHRRAASTMGLPDVVDPRTLGIAKDHAWLNPQEVSERIQQIQAGKKPLVTTTPEGELTKGHQTAAAAELLGLPVEREIETDVAKGAGGAGPRDLEHYFDSGEGTPARVGGDRPFQGGEPQGEKPFPTVTLPEEVIHKEPGEAALPRQAEPEAQTPAITESAPREGQLLPPLQGEQATESRAPYSHEALAPGQTTKQAHTNEAGEWNADRVASTHQRYMDSLRLNERQKPQGRPPEAIILIGGTSTGKTTLSRMLLAEDPNRLRLDSDETKLSIDEYNGLKQSDPENAAFRVHKESTYLTKQALSSAIGRGIDFVYDSTTGGSDAAALIRELKSRGYTVGVAATDAPIETAIARAKKRAEGSDDPINRGRYVPNESIQATHQEAPQTYFKIKDMPEIDWIHLYDASGTSHELAAKRIDAQPEEVYNNGAIERFRAKGQATSAAQTAAPTGPVARPAPAGLGTGRDGGVPAAVAGELPQTAALGAARQLPGGAAPRGSVPAPGEVSLPPAAPAPSGVPAVGLSAEKGPGQGPEAELFAGAPAPKTLGFRPAQAFAKWYDKKIGTPMWEGAQRLANAALHFDTLKRAFLQEGGRPEEFQALKKETKAKADFGAFEGMALGKRLAVGSQADQEILGKILRGELSPDQVRAVRGDPRLQDALDAVRHARNLLDNDLGTRAVLQDLLSDKTFFQNYGKYMPRLYRQFEVDYDGVQQKFGTLKPTRLQMDRFEKRGDIPDEVRMLMGEIKEPAYPVAKGIGQLSRNVAYAEMFDKISQNPEWAAKGEREGFTQMPETNRLGKLSGQWVRSDIASDLNESIRTPSEWGKMWGSVISAYKWNKVVANPASFVWHPTSRVMMNYLGGLPPTRVDLYSRAVLDTVKQTGMWERAAKGGAFDPGQIQAGELNDLLDSWNKTSGNVFQRIGRLSADIAEKAKSGQWGSAIGQAISPTRGYANEALLGMPAKITRLYAGLEQITKTAKFAHNLELGMDDFQAAQDARKWGVDYENVSNSVQFLRRTGIAPFITYPAQAIPLMMESAVRAPWRLATIGLAAYELQDAMRKKLGISAQDDEQIRAATRSYGKPGTGLESGFMGTGVPGMARYIPIMRDREGRIEYLDLAHILHWTGVGQATQPGVQPMGFLDPSTYIAGSPIVSIGGPLLTGRDPYTGRDLTLDYPESGKLGIAAERIGKTFAPSALFQGQAIYRSATGQPGAFGRQPTDLPEQAIGSLTGFNVRPFDPETETIYRQREYREEKGALENKIRRVQDDPRLSDEEAERQLRVLDAQMEKLERKYDAVFGELPQEALPPARP